MVAGMLSRYFAYLFFCRPIEVRYSPAALTGVSP
jgi:hypothetical protein